MNEPYNIVCVADEGYAQHTAVMLCSLFEKNKDKSFRVFLFTDSMKEATIEKLQVLCKRYHSHIEVISITDDGIKDLPIGQWTTMMYYKLFIPTILPKDINRCLFLDVDMVINDDIGPLYNWDLHSSIIAAAEDIPDCIAIKARLGLSQEDIYINSGVMVCDLVKWRKMEELKPIFDFVRSVSGRIINEQDVLALYFKNLMSLLPIRWNMVTFYYFRKPKIFPKYLSDLAKSKKDPGIIHFAAPIKPWFRDCQHPFKSLYRYYLIKTEWGNSIRFPYWEKLTKKQRVNKTIKNFLNRYGFMKDPLYTIHSW